MVHPDYRGRGIATALIGEVAGRVGEAGFEDIGLRVDMRQVRQQLGYMTTSGLKKSSRRV